MLTEQFFILMNPVTKTWYTSMLDSTNEMDNTKLIYKTAKLIRNSIETHLHEKSQSDFSEVSSSRDDVLSQLLVRHEEELRTEKRPRKAAAHHLTDKINCFFSDNMADLVKGRMAQVTCSCSDHVVLPCLFTVITSADSMIHSSGPLFLLSSRHICTS